MLTSELSWRLPGPALKRSSECPVVTESQLQGDGLYRGMAAQIFLRLYLLADIQNSGKTGAFRTQLPSQGRWAQVGELGGDLNRHGRKTSA
jgi:hypothetical protein